MPKNLLLPFYQRLLSIYRQHFVYLFKLCLFFLIQLFIFLFTVILFFLNLIPWYLSIVLVFFAWLFLAIGLFGIFKNLQAIIKGRGEEKYPLFVLDYFISGSQLLIFLLILTLPLIVGIFIFAYGIYTSITSLFLLAGSLFFLSFFFQWYFGLSIIFLLQESKNILFCWQQSYYLIDLNKKNSLILMLINYFLFIIFSLFLPFFGSIFSLIWIVLSSFFFSSYYHSGIKK